MSIQDLVEHIAKCSIICQNTEVGATSDILKSYSDKLRYSWTLLIYTDMMVMSNSCYFKLPSLRDSEIQLYLYNKIIHATETSES